ncbi:MAG: 3'-5' exonuclease [Nitriliruptoraceae bacterium]
MTITASAAAGTFWQGLRLVVLDTETTETPDGTPRRCVSVGAVTCRHGTVRSRWQRLVDPGIPIDPISHSIHHISNDHLAGEASFDDIADELLALLEPRDGETVIIAAHHVGFDISVLRYELQQSGRAAARSCHALPRRTRISRRITPKGTARSSVHAPAPGCWPHGRRRSSSARCCAAAT